MNPEIKELMAGPSPEAIRRLLRRHKIEVQITGGHGLDAEWVWELPDWEEGLFAGEVSPFDLSGELWVDNECVRPLTKAEASEFVGWIDEAIEKESKKRSMWEDAYECF